MPLAGLVNKSLSEESTIVVGTNGLMFWHLPMVKWRCLSNPPIYHDSGHSKTINMSDIYELAECQGDVG